MNGVAEVKGMLDTLKMEVGNSCKCLNLFIDGKPLNPQPVDQGLSYVVSIFSFFSNVSAEEFDQLSGRYSSLQAA